MFEYSADARARGIKDVGVGLALGGVCGGFLTAIYLSGTGAVTWWIFGFALLIFFLAGVLFFVFGCARIVTGGLWDIRVDHGGVSWQAPLIAEKSFRYTLEEICGIEERIRRKTRDDGRVKEKREYVLLGTDGVEHRLTHQSGIDLEAFVAACKSLGIALTERVVPYRRRKDL